MSRRKVDDVRMDQSTMNQEAGNERTVVPVRVAGDGSLRTATFDTSADVPSARRWQSTMRRIDCVEVQRSSSGVRCSLRGAGHRLPVRRTIPLRVGLGLAVLGVPMLVNVESD